MNKQFKIGNKLVGENAPAFIVAEISGNHNQDYQRAVEIIHAAKEAGADESVLTLKSLEALAQVANGNATKIIVPSDLQGLAGLATSLKEIMGEK